MGFRHWDFGRARVSSTRVGGILLIGAIALALAGIGFWRVGSVQAAGSLRLVSCAQFQDVPDLNTDTANSPLTIIVSGACTVSLSNTLKILNPGVTVNLSDPDGLVLDGGNKGFDIIEITDTSGAPTTLNLDNVTIKNGLNGIRDNQGGPLTGSFANVDITNGAVTGNTNDGVQGAMFISSRALSATTESAFTPITPRRWIRVRSRTTARSALKAAPTVASPIARSTKTVAISPTAEASSSTTAGRSATARLTATSAPA